MMSLNDKSLLELPTDVINEIIKFLPKHPIANKFVNHIINLPTGNCRCCCVNDEYLYFHQSYFNSLNHIKFMYKNEMENALKKSVRKIEQIKFMKRYRLSDGASYLQAKKLWKYENRYDSDNDTIDSDDDDVEENGDDKIEI